MNYMDIALEEAKKAYSKGEVPIGAVIVKDGEIIARAHNLKETMKSAIAHAEVLAIEEASKKVGDWRLNGSEMYVTLEPCSMCASAIAQARISKLHIGTFNKDMGACGTILNIFDYDIFNSYVITNWCYNRECSELMSKFFYERRKQN
ncbi:nucleoside deaminase [Clostridium sp. D53t1_180928_C8]|uniref:nucleoside deaminase n=1 Tax=Clostridium sp. D53t1_180928_C8 TaxID=2787101 RepID=UPI0018AAFDDC|nr:nucleoside deaminase [Clostridium sp. D53t1_180928_C8]